RAVLRRMAYRILAEPGQHLRNGRDFPAFPCAGTAPAPAALLGVLGALIMRGAMILAGAALINRFWWTEYVFGTILLWTAIRMFPAGVQDPEPERGWVLRAARRVLPISASYHGERFVVTENGRQLFTPLFLVLLVVETTDVIFAVDSIPAVFGITH